MGRIAAIATLAVGITVISGSAQGQGKTASRGRTPKRVVISPVPASRGWHQAPVGKTAPVDGRGQPRLVLQALNVPDRVELTARGERGGFSAEDLDRAAHLMRDHSGNEHPIDPRLVDTVYRLQVHFKAPEVRVLSGYRTPRSGATSNHGKGRAMDLVVPGVSDDEVAKFARELGFSGVGIYPVSGFVHIDVRERSYFWVDTSGPGKRSRIRGILGDLARQSDSRALARGEQAIGPFLIGTNVNSAVGATTTDSSSFVEEDDGDMTP